MISPECSPLSQAAVAAARALLRAGQWRVGADLLAALPDPSPQVRLAQAELAVECDFWCGSQSAAVALGRAAEAAASAEPEYEWEVALLRLCHTYFGAVMGPDGRPRIGPDHHDPQLRAELAAVAEQLHRTAPAGSRAGWAAFWRGVIADNINAAPERAQRCYSEALAIGEAAGDDALIGEALRHQGGHARAAGDHGQAQRCWRRSAAAKQRAGLVPGVLSQQLALARHALDTGDSDQAATIAAQVQGWAAALGLTRLAAQAEALGLR